MHRLALLTTLVLSATACDPGRKLGIAGATCTASSDCAEDLQCITATCIDLAAAHDKRTADALAARDAECKQAMDALMAELDALKAAQKRLEAEKKTLDDRLGKLIDPDEKARLLAEKALLDAQIAEQANKPGNKPGRPAGETRASKKAVDPLEGR